MRVVVLVALAGVSVDVLVSQSSELSGAASYLSSARPWWLLAAAGAEAASMMCFAVAENRLLVEAGAKVTTRSVFSVVLGANAVTNSLPAGPAFAAAYSWRRLRRLGAEDLAAGWTLIAVNVITAASLAFLAGAGVAGAVSEGMSVGLVGVAAGVLFFAGLALVFLRHPLVASRWTRRVLSLTKRLFRHPSDPQASADAVHRQLSHVRPTWRGLAGVSAWSLANWMLDCACLVAAFGAVGAPVPWAGLLVAYGGAQLAANLPITPGGLGVVEGSLAIGLVAFGGAEPSTVAAVIIYRLFSFWALLIIGWAVAGGVWWFDRRQPEAVPVPVPVESR